MQKLVESLDSLQTGENSHCEKKWQRGDFNNELVQLFFQLCRGKASESAINIYGKLVGSCLAKQDKYQANRLLSLMVQTRDASEGKKETALFYNMLEVWDRNINDFSWVSIKMRGVLRRILGVDAPTNPYGSFRDIKYIIDTYKGNRNWEEAACLRKACESPVICILLEIATCVLCKDLNESNQSLLGKWLPREKSKFGWQAPLFTKPKFDAYEWYGLSSLNKASRLAAYRRNLASLNRILSTVQVHQCNGNWANINFDAGITSATLRLQKKAFLIDGKKKLGDMDAVEQEDRKACRDNYNKYISRCLQGKCKIKAKDVTMGNLVKDLWNTSYTVSETVNDSVELMYRAKVDEVTRRGKLQDFCVICDTSGSMGWENAPLYDAVGISLLISEISSLGSRVMTFASDPMWLNLDKCSSFTEKVKVFKESQLYTGGSTDLYKSFKLLLHAVKDAKLSATEVGNLNLLLLSDMQINSAVQGNMDVVSDAISKLFRNEGYPNRPRLVFWNMRSTSGFPVSSFTEDGTLLLSGYEVSTLQGLIDKGADALSEMTPVNNLLSLLESDRYAWFYDAEN